MIRTFPIREDQVRVSQFRSIFIFVFCINCLCLKSEKPTLDSGKCEPETGREGRSKGQ